MKCATITQVRDTSSTFPIEFFSFVLSPTGPLNRCEDDVRRFFEAAEKGVKRALKAGARKPLMVVIPDENMPQEKLRTHTLIIYY